MEGVMKKLILMLCGMTMLLMVIGCSEERTKLTEFATSPESDFVEFEEGVFNDSRLGKHAAGCVTLKFNFVGKPPSYTEEGITVTSLTPIAHLHLTAARLISTAHFGQPVNVYEFRHEGGESFAVVSVDILRKSGVGDFVSSDDAVVPILFTFGTITFPVEGWSNITSFRWNTSGTIHIDNLVICQAASPNDPPTADAGTDQTVLVGAIVQLDGSGSSDADGDPLTYSWSLFSKPGGSFSTLTSTTAVNPSFSPDVAGEYVVELKVNDGTDDSDPAQVTITAQTAQQAAQDVIGNIETLLADALLSAGQGNSLIKKLESAIKKLDKEQKKVALNMLNAFINHVNSLIDEGVLTSADGNPLISAIQDIVDSLSAGLA